MTLSKSFQVSGLLATAEVARQMGVHRSTVWHWIKTGALKCERHGTFLGVKQSELDRLRAIYVTTDTVPAPKAPKAKPKTKRGGKRRKAA